MNYLSSAPFLPGICDSSEKLTGPYFRKFVCDHDLILVPSFRERPASWTYSARCLWDAPDYLTTKWALLPFLSHLSIPILTVFFKDTLDVHDVSSEDLTLELGAMKAKIKPDIKVVQDIYLRLQEMSADLGPECSESIL
jgi:hypothetical protein